MFGTPVVEQTPRTQYGATAYGLLGETKNSSTRTLFGQPELPLHSSTDMNNPSLMDPSTSLGRSAPLENPEDEDKTSGRLSAASGDAGIRDNPRRHGQLEALESMNNPMREAPLGSHLYDVLGASAGARHGLLSTSPDAPATAPPAIKSLSFPLPDVAKAHFGDRLNRPDTFVPHEEGLFGSSRRLLQIAPPPFPPSSPIGLSSQSGDYYASSASVVTAGYGFYGTGATSTAAQVISPGYPGG